MVVEEDKEVEVGIAVAAEVEVGKAVAEEMETVGPPVAAVAGQEVDMAVAAKV